MEWNFSKKPKWKRYDLEHMMGEFGQALFENDIENFSIDNKDNVATFVYKDGNKKLTALVSLVNDDHLEVTFGGDSNSITVSQALYEALVGFLTKKNDFLNWFL
jgi:hypothetical protein